MRFFKKQYLRLRKPKNQSEKSVKSKEEPVIQPTIAIDVCRCVNDILYIEGWSLPMSTDVELCVYSGHECIARAQLFIIRDDVAAAFPSVDRAKESGFRIVTVIDSSFLKKIFITRRCGDREDCRKELKIEYVTFPVERNLVGRDVIAQRTCFTMVGGRLVVAGIIASKSEKPTVCSLELLVRDNYGAQWNTPVQFPFYPIEQPDAIFHHTGFYTEFWLPGRGCNALLKCIKSNNSEEIIELGTIANISNELHQQSSRVPAESVEKYSDIIEIECNPPSVETLCVGQHKSVTVVVGIVCRSVEDIHYLRKTLAMLIASKRMKRLHYLDVKILVLTSPRENSEFFVSALNYLQTEIDDNIFTYLESPVNDSTFSERLDYIVQRAETLYGEYDYFLHLSAWVVAHPRMLERFVAFSENMGCLSILEGRRLPVDIDKEYNIDTFETEWVDSSCCFIPVCLYKELGGFDSSLTEYTAVVDFCWRAKKAGYKSLRVFDAIYFCLDLQLLGGDYVDTKGHYESSYLLGCKYNNKIFSEMVLTKICEIGHDQEITSIKKKGEEICKDAVENRVEDFMTFDEQLLFCQTRW